MIKDDIAYGKFYYHYDDKRSLGIVRYICALYCDDILRISPVRLFVFRPRFVKADKLPIEVGIGPASG